MSYEKIGFVIMQIGNSELDNVFNEVFCKALAKVGLKPKRIDKDNTGRLLKSEITEFIEAAEIIIADLTNERPNCYLEVGYAMGLDKYKNLIFTVREDHYNGSPNYKITGPKVHFDLTGYDILFWDPTKLEDFRDDLVNRINRRLAMQPSIQITPKPLWALDWLKTQREYTQQKLVENQIGMSSEILISPVEEDLNISQSTLLEVAEKSRIMTFGWPHGPIIHEPLKHKPIPKPDGIISEVDMPANSMFRKHYDFTYFRKNGQIFIFKDIFEDGYFPQEILINPRIDNTTEILLYAGRFYTALGLSEKAQINIKISYSGIKGKTLSRGKSAPPPYPPKVSQEDYAVSEIVTSIADIEKRLPELVRELLNPLFILFNFYEVANNELENEVNDFVSRTRSGN